MDGNGQDPALFDQINSALIGDLPSFGAGKESKFQQLMRNNSMNNNGFGQFQGQDAGQDIRSYASFDSPSDADKSLCADAKEFKPTVPLSGHSFVSTISSLDSLNISGQNGTNQNVPALRPNPAAREFVPRNQSAPNLHAVQTSAATSMAAPAIPGIREFIPSSRLSQIGGRQNGAAQQQTISYAPVQQQQRFMSQGSLRAMGDQEIMGMTKSGNSSMRDAISGVPGTPGMDAMPTNGHGNVFSSSQPPTFYAGGDSDSSISQSPHPGFLPSTSSPYGRQSMLSNGSVGNMSHILGSRSGSDTSERSSPLQSRRAASHLGHRSSPLEPLNTESHSSSDAEMQAKVAQENFGGTTYFYTQGQKRQQNLPVVVPEFNVFSGSPPSVEYLKPRMSAPSFFMPNELRQAIMKKQTLTMLTVDTEQDSSVPSEVDNYHSLFPIEPISSTVQQKSSTFGFVTSCYKAIKYKDGLPYCLRRIHGFRQVNQKCMVLVEMWKKIQHANIVILREVFTSKAFGEHSLIFCHDYHAGAETLMTRHFQNPNNNYASKLKWNANSGKQSGLLQEGLIWTYIVQLTSALRCIHAAGLACRVMDPTKIIITEKSRLRINGVGVFDVLGYDNSHSNPRAHMPQYQQDDLIALGKVVLALACNLVSAIQRDNFPQSLDLVAMNYSVDLKNFILYLLTPQQRPRSVNDIMPMIGARFYTQLDAALLRGDVIEDELSKEVENGRLFRLVSKLCLINERPGVSMDSDWSETGDRYLLKLFRDHVFHQVTETGAPWIDLAHIVQCLNKLDAGTPEKLCLMSRDEKNVLVVSYSDLKKAFENCFTDLITLQR